MDISTEEVAGMYSHFEGLIAFYATRPEECDREKLLEVNFDIHQAIKAHPGVPRSRYLIAAMDTLKNPLRQDLPIPWAKIRDLGVRDLEEESGLKSGPSRKARARTAEGGHQNGKAKRSRTEELTTVHRNEKGKNVQIDYTFGQDNGEDVTVKMEETRFEITPAPSNQMRRSSSRTIKSRNVPETSSTQQSETTQVTTQRSRGRSVGSGTKSRASSVASAVGVQTKRPARGRPSSARLIKAAGSSGVHSEAETENEITKITKRKARRTHATRIEGLEITFRELKKEMADKDDEIAQLLEVVKEREAMEEQLRLQLDNYKEEHRSMKIDIERLLGQIREVERLSGQPSTVQGDVGTAMNLVVEFDHHSSSTILNPTTSVVTVGQDVHPTGIPAVINFENDSAIPEEMNFANSPAAAAAETNLENNPAPAETNLPDYTSSVTSNPATAAEVSIRQEEGDCKPTCSIRCIDSVVFPAEIKHGEQDMDVDSRSL